MLVGFATSLVPEKGGRREGESAVHVRNLWFYHSACSREGRTERRRERGASEREREKEGHRVLCFLRQRQRHRHRERGRSKDERYLKVLVEKQRLVALEVCAKPCGSKASLLFHSPFSERKICECVFFPVELWASRVSIP